jgi:hypothetical protein
MATETDRDLNSKGSNGWIDLAKYSRSNKWIVASLSHALHARHGVDLILFRCGEKIIFNKHSPARSTTPARNSYITYV